MGNPIRIMDLPTLYIIMGLLLHASAHDVWKATKAVLFAIRGLGAFVLPSQDKL